MYCALTANTHTRVNEASLGHHVNEAARQQCSKIKNRNIKTTHSKHSQSCDQSQGRSFVKLPVSLITHGERIRMINILFHFQRPTVGQKCLLADSSIQVCFCLWAQFKISGLSWHSAKSHLCHAISASEWKLGLLLNLQFHSFRSFHHFPLRQKILSG